MQKRAKKLLEELEKIFSSELGKSDLKELFDELYTVADSLPFEKVTNGARLESESNLITGEVAVYSDGACRGNPGPGSWGIVGLDHEGEILFQGSGVEVSTTNNRMELAGVIECFINLERMARSEVNLNVTKVKVYSDSKYVVDGVSKWLAGWKKKGWKKSDGKAPENIDLWRQMDYLNEKYKDMVEYHWVKGHAGHPQNEFCDQLANKALDDAGF